MSNCNESKKYSRNLEKFKNVILSFSALLMLLSHYPLWIAEYLVTILAFSLTQEWVRTSWNVFQLTLFRFLRCLQIHHYKFQFNQSFLALRDKKIKIIKEVSHNIQLISLTFDKCWLFCFYKVNNRLAFCSRFQLKETVAELEEVQRKIDPYSKRTIPKIPEMMPDECPEK